MHLRWYNGSSKQTRKLNILKIISNRLEILKVFKPDRLQESINIAESKEFLVSIKNLNS